MRRTLTGAWIETGSFVSALALWRVAPSRVRGLKLFSSLVTVFVTRRTLTGAWIETANLAPAGQGLLVAPSRVRGLKLRNACLS